jgi:lysophospholipase L1-like esterase
MARRSLTVLGALSLSLLPHADAAMTVPADSPYVQFAGRVRRPGNGTVCFDWLGTTARVQWSGSYLRADFVPTTTGSPFKVAAWEYNQGYYVAEGYSWAVPASATNGTFSALVAANGGDTIVSLNSPPQYFTGEGRPGADVCLSGFTTDGTIKPAASPLSRTMVFIGDSITAATNIHGHNPGACGDEGMQCDYSASWAGLLSAAYGANSTTIAVGGKGLIRNCCDSKTTMPGYFLQEEYSSGLPFDFSAAPKPDAVLSLLGTNDYSGGAPAPGFDAKFTAAYVEFLQNITSRYDAAPPNGNITFFLATSPMTSLPDSAIVAAVEAANGAGLRAVLLNISDSPTDGCAGHPGVLGHWTMAQLAKPVIDAVMGWST